MTLWSEKPPAISTRTFLDEVCDYPRDVQKQSGEEKNRSGNLSEICEANQTKNIQLPIEMTLRIGILFVGTKLYVDIKVIVWFSINAMNSSLVKSVPQGDFVEISALMDSWETKFQTLVSQKKPIWFDMFPNRNIPPDIANLLSQRGYKDLILANDQWQHFLVPNSVETPLTAA